MLLMKTLSVLTHTVLQADVPILLDSLITNTPIKMLCPYKHTVCQSVVPLQAHRLSKCCGKKIA